MPGGNRSVLFCCFSVSLHPCLCLESSHFQGAAEINVLVFNAQSIQSHRYLGRPDFVASSATKTDCAPWYVILCTVAVSSTKGYICFQFLWLQKIEQLAQKLLRVVPTLVIHLHFLRTFIGYFPDIFSHGRNSKNMIHNQHRVGSSQNILSLGLDILNHGSVSRQHNSCRLQEPWLLNPWRCKSLL